jgi:glucose/arabinose dehydrogenase
MNRAGLARSVACMPSRGIRLLVASALATLGLAAPATAATLPTGFQETTVFSGLTNPSNIEFAPDGRVFVAEKSGLIKVFDGLSDPTPTTFADLRTNVHNFWDRGMLGLALAPNFPSDPHVYVLYTHDAAIGGNAPRWGTAGATSDGCPSPPGPTADGCVVSGRLSRLTANGNVMSGSEQVLIEDWCQQYPSHSVGDLGFGADGALYVSAGDGASFNFADWGQDGSPVNPCGDPPGGPGSALSPPTAEGGALRSQDVRTLGTSVPGGSHRLRPDGDISSGWVAGGAATAWDALNDPVAQPAEPTGDDVIYEGVQGATTEVSLAGANLGGATPISGKAWFYGNASPGLVVRADVIWGGSVRASKTIGGPNGADYQWHGIDVTPPNQAAVDDLRIRFTVVTGAEYAGNVFAAYFDLETAGSTTSGDPTGLDGTVLRVDPATGAGLPGNPMASSSDPNARRIVAYGLRNPFRFAMRPGGNEVWLGDVGWNATEEINRIATPADSTADNFGWPCYEGTVRQSGYDAANLNLCESLYATGAVSAPHYGWSHSSKVVANETCPSGGSSASGVSFYTGGSYPAAYGGAMFFADYSRRCIWAMQADGGQPSPSKLVTFAADAAGPVDLEVGPGGDLFYAGFDDGTIRRISYQSANRPPVAVATATPTTGPAPLAVQFNGSGSSDPDAGDALTYAWDLDADGAYDDSTAANPTRTYAAGSYVVRLRVTDRQGATATASVTINAGSNTPPRPVITTPSSGSTWQVGQSVPFAGTAADDQDGTLPASRLSWQLNLEHCPSNCHTHGIQGWPGVSSASFVAPDHEYPSHLSLVLTATDSGGLTASKTLRLDPRTYRLTMSTYNPTGLSLVFNGSSALTPFSRTVIRGSRNTISAPTPQTRSGRTYAFSSWSDGGAQTHTITATADRTYRATYRRISRAETASLAACKRKSKGKGKRAKKQRKRCLARATSR